MINIGKIQKFVKACGVKNILCTKPVNLNKASSFDLKFNRNIKTDIFKYSENSQKSIFEKLLNRKLNLGSAKNAQADVSSSILSQSGWNHTIDDMNNYLRYSKGNIQSLPAEHRATIKKLDDAFTLIQPTQKDVIYIRGERFNRENERFFKLKNAKQGEIFGLNNENPNYLFFTENSNYAKHFADYGNGKKVILHTLIPQGSKLPLNTLEQGVAITPRNSKYKVLDNKEDSNGNITLFLEYLLE